MISQAYAVFVLPAVFGLLTKLALRAEGASVGVTLVVCVVVVLVLAAVGDEVESYYFREIREKRECWQRAIRFAALLPAIWTAGLATLFLPYWVPLVPVFVACPLALGVCAVSLWYLLQDDVRRGGRLYCQRYVERLARRQLKAGEPSVPFGGAPVALDKVCLNVCFIGAVGSGKTTAIKAMMGATIPRIGRSKASSRALVYDPKTEFFGFLSGLATCPVYTLHPLDQRCRAPDFAKLVRTPMEEHQFGVMLVPPAEGPNAYFSNAARSVLTGVLHSFNLHAPGAWTFRDLFHACESKERLRVILSRDPSTRICVEKYLHAKEASSILSELDTHLQPFRPIAACWARAEPIDLDAEFVRGQSVVILPMHRTAEDQLRLLNGLIFGFLVQRLMDEQTNEQRRRAGLPDRQTTVFFDEIRDAASRLPDLKTFFTMGRAYGIGNVVGYQSQKGLEDAMNQNRAPELLGQCHYKGFLNVTEHETGKYIAQMCHEREVYKKNDDGTHQVTTEPVVMPAAFSQLEGNMFRGYYMAPEPLGLWKSELPWPERKPADPSAVPDFLPRPDSDQELLSWTAADLERLHLPLSLLDEGKEDAKQTQEAATSDLGPIEAIRHDQKPANDVPARKPGKFQLVTDPEKLAELRKRLAASGDR
jgi:hypothetical protein